MNSLELLGYGSAGLAMPEITTHLQIRKPKTGEIIYDIKKHNRVLKLPLFTMLRAINGEFSQCDDSTVAINKKFQLYNFIPRFVAFGSSDQEVDINDTKLGKELDEPRMRLTRSNSLENQYNNPYIKITIKHFVPLTSLVNQDLAEVGLFCEETGDNCFARITFDPFTKDDTTVIDLTWEITIIIIETETEPYSQVNKVLLKQAIRNGMNYISNQYPDYIELMRALRKAIDTYVDQASTQTKIDESTQELLLKMEEI